MGECSSAIGGFKGPQMVNFVGRRTSDNPFSLRSRTLGKVMPPEGPKVEDLSPVSICGVEAECFRALLWRMGGIAGEGGISSVVLRMAKSEVLVRRLS